MAENSIKPLRILYFSTHSILEAEELKLFGELGWDYLSLGAYFSPFGDESTDVKRPPLPAEHNLWSELKDLGGGNWDKDHLKPEQIEPFDVIVVMHNPVADQPWINNNWEVLKHKKVVWRSIGQSSRIVEKSLEKARSEGLKIVRYSPKEKNIPSYVGEDAMIRFYKDEGEYQGWTGENRFVISVAQSMPLRQGSCNYRAFCDATAPFERRLYGPGNESSGLQGGYLEYEKLKEVLRTSRVFFNCGTQPASYTLGFIEALMSGIPVVSIGPKHGNHDYPEQQTFEIQDIIRNGENGYISDDIGELQKYIGYMLQNEGLARQIGEAGRKTAIELFGKNKIKLEWKDFIEGVCKS